MRGAVFQIRTRRLSANTGRKVPRQMAITMIAAAGTREAGILKARLFGEKLFGCTDCHTYSTLDWPRLDLGTPDMQGLPAGTFAHLARPPHGADAMGILDGL